LIRAPNRAAQSAFFKTVAGLIARRVMNSHKGSPSKFAKFWDAKPFTKLVEWGRQYKTVLHYLTLNSLEAIGFTKVSAREFLRAYSSA
jgi:hypothetical protein